MNTDYVSPNDRCKRGLQGGEDRKNAKSLGETPNIAMRQAWGQGWATSTPARTRTEGIEYWWGVRANKVKEQVWGGSDMHRVA